MRKAVLILLALGGCGQKGPRDATEPADPANGAALNLAVAAAPTDPAQLQALIERGMASSLRDPKAAQYRNVRAGAGGAACGEVAVRPGAPFLPFVVTPDALAVLGTRPDIAWEDPDDFLADAWIRWCASPEELAKLGPRLQNAARSAPPPPGNEVSAAIPSPIDPSVVAVDPPPPPPSDRVAPPPAPAPPPKPAPPPQIDSFFNSVQHKDR
jgi:hypothetical protein